MRDKTETATPRLLSVSEPTLPELWILEGGLDALTVAILDDEDLEYDLPYIAVAGGRKVQ